MCTLDYYRCEFITRCTHLEIAHPIILYILWELDMASTRALMKELMPWTSICSTKAGKVICICAWWGRIETPGTLHSIFIIRRGYMNIIPVLLFCQPIYKKWFNDLKLLLCIGLFICYIWTNHGLNSQNAKLIIAIRLKIGLKHFVKYGVWAI